MSRDGSELWEGCSLPAWVPGSEDDLFARFLEHLAGQPAERRGASGWHGCELRPRGSAADRAYTLGLMTFVRMRFRQWGYVHSLPKENLEPDDVAQDLMQNLLKKTATLRLDHPCPKVLLDWLGQRSSCFVLTAISRAQSKNRRRPVSASDLGGEGDPIDRRADAGPPTGLAAVQRRLREAEDDCCRGVYGPIDRVQALFRLLAWYAVRGYPAGADKDGNPVRRAGLPPMKFLPGRKPLPNKTTREGLKDKVTREQVNLVTSRIRRVVRDAGALAGS